jgi:hypothetical protein
LGEKLRLNNHGSSLLFSLGLIAAIGGFSLFIMQAMLQQSKQSKLLNHKLTASLIKNNIENILRDDAAWAQIVNQANRGDADQVNLLLACVAGAADCYSLAFNGTVAHPDYPDDHGPTDGGNAGNGWRRIYTVRTPDDGIFYYYNDSDATRAAEGLDKSGERCSTYVPRTTGEGTNHCPFRLHIFWRPYPPNDCQPGACTAGGDFDQVEIVSVLEYNGKSMTPIDTRSYRVLINGRDI